MIIGIRSYLTKENITELSFQVMAARKSFPNDKIIVAVCGERPDKSVYETANEVIYYSEKPLGPLRPWQILVDFAKNDETEELIVVDGDDQHIFSEIKKIYTKNKGKAEAIIPQRKKRVIYITNSDIDRVTIEDLENAYVRRKYPNVVKDIQPGLFILLTKKAINCLKLGNVSPWADDLIAVDQFYNNGLDIISTPINVRSQRTNTFNQDVIFRRIAEFEKYFKKDFLNIIEEVQENPSKYLFEGKISEISIIRKSFKHYKNIAKAIGMKGLILAGGLGTGLRPITNTMQKQLIPIANKPIIFYVIEDIINAGIINIGIIVGPNKEQVIHTVGDGKRWGINIEYIEQDAPRGLAHAVKIAKKYLLDSDFVMYLGDNLLKGGIRDFVDSFNDSTAEASILLTKVKDPRRFGVAKLDDKGQITALIEKPKEPPSDLAVVGIYAFKKSIFEAIDNIKPSWRNELEITDALDWLLRHKKIIKYNIVSGWWKDTGKPTSLLEANHLVLDNMEPKILGDVSSESFVMGKVSIGAGTIIKKGADIRGPIVIGENCEIGENVFIGPYTSIGNGVKFISGEVEHSIVLDNCIIETNKRIVDSLIGRDCSIKSQQKKPHFANILIIGDNSNIEF